MHLTRNPATPVTLSAPRAARATGLNVDSPTATTGAARIDDILPARGPRIGRHIPAAGPRSHRRGCQHQHQPPPVNHEEPCFTTASPDATSAAVIAKPGSSPSVCSSAGPSGPEPRAVPGP